MNSVDSYSIMNEVELKLTQIANKYCEAEEFVRIITTLRKASKVRTDIQGNLYYKTFDINLSGSMKKYELRNLAIISWFLPKELRAPLIVAIQNKIGNNINLYDLKIFLKSKGLTMSYLLSYYYEKGGHNLFGTLLDETKFTIEHSLRFVKVKVQKSYMEYFEKSVIKAPKPFIGVGYKDKNSRPLDMRGSLYNFMLTSVQRNVEELRDLEESLVLITEGFLM
jgi:hypothetical protein